jgi:hypothetical protein
MYCCSQEFSEREKGITEPYYRNRYAAAFCDKRWKEETSTETELL